MWLFSHTLKARKSWFFLYVRPLITIIELQIQAIDLLRHIVQQILDPNCIVKIGYILLCFNGSLREISLNTIREGVVINVINLTLTITVVR